MQANWRYTLIMRDGSTRVIETPDGWDTFTLSYKRNLERHGMFNEIQDGSFKFKRSTAKLLRQEYEAYGAQGNIRLQIEQRSKTGFRVVYNGQLAFDSFSESYEEGEYTVSVGCDQIGPYVDLVNRFDQTVDLSADKCFDGVTPLADYQFMNFPIKLPSKTIRLANYAYPQVTDAPGDTLSYDLLRTNIDPNNPGQATNDADYSPAPNTAQKGIVLWRFNKVDTQEITDFTPPYQFDYIEINTQSLKQALTGQQVQRINYKSALVKSNVYNLDIKMKGDLTLKYQSGSSQNSISYKLTAYVKYKNLQDVVPAFVIGQGLNAFPPSSTPTIRTIPIDYTYIGAVTMDPNDNLWVYILLELTNATNASGSPFQSIKFTATPDSHLRISSDVKAQATYAQVFRAYESFSRIIESLTNNQLRLYSEYLGAPDTEPYSFPSRGCGANRVLTNGKAIRGIVLANDPAFPVTKSPNVGVFTSAKDAFASFKATDNIGIGLEGSNIRLEPWTWFYKSDILLSFRDIDKIQRKTQASEIYSVFKFGYEKWEAEDSNGLDDIFGKREYHLDISQVSNPLEQISKFIASGYAIEVTRRIGQDSSDWRYDNDMFIICVEPDGASYKVEINNIVNASNLIDPATIYNFRISPTRNGLRWFSRVIGSYRNVTTGHRIIFGSGDANYKAAGQMATIDCTLEAGVLAENQDLSLSVFANQADGLPIMWAERVTFSHRLGASQYQQIVANPYGLIEYSSPAMSGQGWIEQVDYRASEGMADFTLIPKIL